MNEKARLELKTIAKREDGCFSAVLWDGRPFAVSVERTFDDLRVVIGNGRFLCKRSFYNHGQYWTYEIMVEGHSRVLFHKGNKETDSLACVVVAESFAMMDGVTAVGDSKHGFEEFMALTEGLSQFWMEVSGR